MTRLLIVSNTSFNLTDSNGRVLGLLLKGISNEDKIQFCITGGSVSPELIEVSYRISDKQALRGVLSRRINSTKLPHFADSLETGNSVRRIKRSATTMLIRDLLWYLCINRTEFLKIAKEYNPNIILWQYGNSGFMAKLTRKLAEECNAKIVVYSTEDYYFKTWNYMNKARFSLIYSLFYREMRAAQKKVFDSLSLCICNTPSLADRFKKEMNCPIKVVMQSSSDYSASSSTGEIKNRIVYAGNMGLERPSSLIKIANALMQINSEIVFEIYGKADDETLNLFAQLPIIRYMGFVSYKDVLDIMRTSLLVVHAESFDDFYRRDLMAAFSTKIPDCLMSGTPLFLFAPEELAVTQYIRDNRCAFLCTDEKRLVDCLSDALYKNEQRIAIVDRAKEMVALNHNELDNQIKFADYLHEISTN